MLIDAILPCRILMLFACHFRRRHALLRCEILSLPCHDIDAAAITLFYTPMPRFTHVTPLDDMLFTLPLMLPPCRRAVASECHYYADEYNAMPCC